MLHYDRSRIFLMFISIHSFITLGKLDTETCGKKYEGAGLVYGGEPVEAHSWPWLIALWNVLENKLFCGGNLVSEQHVITGEILDSN